MQKSGKDVSPEATLRRARSGCIIVYLFIYRYIYVVKAWAACRLARRARPYLIAGGRGESPVEWEEGNWRMRARWCENFRGGS